jgi:hypothetical protein
MWNEYFERKDRDDWRRANYARLDAAFATSAPHKARKPRRGSLRVTLGLALMRAGAWLAGEAPGRLPAHR